MADFSFNHDELTLAVSTCIRGSGGGGGTFGGGSIPANRGAAYWKDASGKDQTVEALPGSSGSASYTTTNTRMLKGWTSIRVSRGIERCPNDFEVEFTEPSPAVSDVIIQPGDECQIYLGTDLVLSGFVDRYMPSYNAHTHTIRVSGRGRCQDLVDCSAKWTGGQMENMPILMIAQQLCAVYGIRVTLADGSDPGTPVQALNIAVGEPIHDVLERLCRVKQLLQYEQEDGSLLLSEISTEQAASGFKEGQNVLAASAVYGMDGRFSDYDAVLQAIDICKDLGDGGNLIARVSDANVPRFRYRAIVAEQVNGSYPLAVQRAEWEMYHRIGRSFQVRVTTDSWRDSAGKLWRPNTLVPLDLPGLKLNPVLWTISDVTFRVDLHKGTTCELLIMPPQAFSKSPLNLYPIAPDVKKG